MFIKHSLFAAAVLLSVTAGTADAAVLDVTTGTNDGTTLTMPDATITAGTGTTLLVGDFIANAVCPLGNFGCNGSMTLTFDFDVSNVAFDFGFGNLGDSATITGFDSIGNVVGVLLLSLISGTDTASLAAFGTLRSILFDNTASTGAGYAYGNISFETAAVPLPAGLPLLAAGLGLMGLMGRKSRKSSKSSVL